MGKHVKINPRRQALRTGTVAVALPLLAVMGAAGAYAAEPAQGGTTALAITAEPLLPPGLELPPIDLPPLPELPPVDPGPLEPPVVEPPVIEPPVVVPPVEPPVIEPPVIEPPVIEPPVIEPPVVTPPVVVPPVEPPVVTPPVVTPPVVVPPAQPPVVAPPVVTPETPVTTQPAPAPVQWAPEQVYPAQGGAVPVAPKVSYQAEAASTAAAPVSAPAKQALPKELAYTGIEEELPLIGTAAGLLILGAGAVVASRRRPQTKQA